MKHFVQVFLFFPLMLLLVLNSFGQTEKSPYPSGFRIEAGIGPGAVMPGGGLSGRLALAILYKGWGGTVRGTFHDGRVGTGSSGDWFEPPTEKYNEKALLATRVIHTIGNVQLLASGGISMMDGSRLTEDKFDLEPMPQAIGFGGEFEAAYTGNIVGVTASLITSINGRANMVALVLSLSLAGMSK